jgi:hypothetical protein
MQLHLPIHYSKSHPSCGQLDLCCHAAGRALLLLLLLLQRKSRARALLRLLLLSWGNV